MKTISRRRLFFGTGGVAAVALACTAAYTFGSGSDTATRPAAAGQRAGVASSASTGAGGTTNMLAAALPGMPEYDPTDLYSADRPNQLSPTVRNFPNFVYVPNSESNTVSVIDPTTFKVVRTVPVGEQPQHVVPSWDLKTLWVNNDIGNSLTPIDAATGQFGTPVPVHDPYNLYFTPDGKSAMVMAEADKQIVFRDPHTMAVQQVLHVPCEGVNHADFAPDGSYFIASCEFSGQLLKVNTATRSLVGVIDLEKGAMPQDVKISPDGKAWYVADMATNGLWELNGDQFKLTGFLPTGAGAHGLYVSRDSKDLYVTNRGEGSISVLDFATNTVQAKWKIPGDASPDMGGVSADGKTLWLSGRYNSEVYAISTADGHLLARIPVGDGPHGLCVYPQPGRYSLGHTGVFR